ncbi:MAG: NAD(P)H-hydrate dehydratase, partial [Pseudomonadota bacterium]
LVLGPSREGPGVALDGNPGMATGGVGDILTGTIASLRAQGLGVAAAARTGVCLHGAAGDAAADEGGERGLIATDLLPHVRVLANPHARPVQLNAG